MGRLPKGWNKNNEDSSVATYESEKYKIYIWKKKDPKSYAVETFRKLKNYKRRIFKEDFKDLKRARSFAWDLMKKEEIRGYYGKSK